MSQRRTKKEPYDNIRKGDVIKWNGMYRIVRDVSFNKYGLVTFVTFAIKHRSWTNRPYTVYSQSDIRKYFSGIVLRNVTLCGRNPIECLVQKEIESSGYERYICADQMAGTVY